MECSEVELALWNRIKQFSLDDPEASFSFTHRLARDNHWSLAYADRVVTEYKKFMFLAVCCKHVVTPSDQVDQAWHLHMIYTRSYWDEFCGLVLKQPIHHGPTKGGKSETDKFVDLYELTKQSYRQKFGEAPAEDIWPSSQERFDKEDIKKWISRKDYWIIRKPKFSNLSSKDHLPMATAAAAPLLLFAWSPYELDGKSFLIFYATLAVAAASLSLVLQYLLKSNGLEQWENFWKGSSLDTNAVAYLSGGESQLLKSACCELMAAGKAKSFGHQLQLISHAATTSELSQVASAIYGKLKSEPSINHKTIKLTAALPIAQISSALVRAGLIESRVKRHVIGWTSGLIMSGVLAVGIGRLVQAAGSGRPVGFLVLEMLVTVGLMAAILFAIPFRTKTGDQVISEHKANLTSLSGQQPHLASDPNEVALLVGLYGTSILAGTAYSSFGSDLKNILTPEVTTSSGGSGCVTSSCSSGCGSGCGGGCGGCGG